MPQRDGVENTFTNIFLIIVRRYALLAGNIQVIQLKQSHHVRSGCRTVDWTVITVLEEERQQAAVVKMSMAYDHGIQGLKLKPRIVQSWKSLERSRRAWVYAAIQQHAAFSGLKEEG